MLSKLTNKYFIYKNRFLFKQKGVSYGKQLMAMGPTHLLIRGTLNIGDHCNIISGRMQNVLSRNLKTGIRVDNGAKVTIGDHVGMSCVCIWSAESVVIGDHVKLGAGVIIFDSDMHSLDFMNRRTIATDAPNAKVSPITIGNDVFVGAQSVITKGVSIGDRSIVAVGSVVTKSIPADEIWGGNPAQFIKSLI
ncbi:MAG: acyltransferase [Leeuwenhoekiella sp.]